MTSSPSKSPSKKPKSSPSISPVTSEVTSSPSYSPVVSSILPTRSPSASPVSSEPTPTPSKSPITLEVTNSPSKSPVQAGLNTCILITTGNGRYDNGYLDVLVDTGNGYDVVTTTEIKYTQDEVVLDECYSGLVGVQVTNTQTNAWAGRIAYSLGNKASVYSPMKCTDCTGTVDTTENIVVDGDGNGTGDTQCLNGQACTLVLDID